MESTKKKLALLYLDKNGFYFYEEGLGNVASLPFAETSVKDMDIVNPISLEAQVKTFVEQYQIAPASINIILSPHITFDKEIIDLPPQERDDAVSKFVDTIPFESTLHKVFPIEKGVLVIGSNAEMTTELAASFEKVGSTIDLILPYQLLGTDQTLIQNLIPENALQFLRHIDKLKNLSLKTIEREKTQSQTPTNSTPQEKPKTNKPRLYAMAGIFIVLFVILGFMIVNME